MILICPNPYRDEKLELSNKAASLLDAAGYKTEIRPVFTGKKIGCLENVELIIVVGGDGTLLSVAGEIHDSGIPVLGINLGTKGFMASLEAKDIGLIVKAAGGEYRTSERMMIDVWLNGEYRGAALNDAVIHGRGDCISLYVKCDETVISTISGDGIILSTPTGSTGYSMSAGGPIVEPEAKSIIVSPICAHSIGSRSFVLDSGRTVSVEIQRLHDKKAYLSIDGQDKDNLNVDDTLTVKKSECSIKIVDLGVKSFYETAFEKLS